MNMHKKVDEMVVNRGKRCSTQKSSLTKHYQTPHEGGRFSDENYLLFCRCVGILRLESNMFYCQRSSKLAYSSEEKQKKIGARGRRTMTAKKKKKKRAILFRLYRMKCCLVEVRNEDFIREELYSTMGSEKGYKCIYYWLASIEYLQTTYSICHYT